MFSSTETCGWNDSILSNWKLLTSRIATDSASRSGMMPENAVPMLPPTACFLFASWNRRPASAVVVVFPFVPVIARIGAGQNQLASSSSLTIRSFRRSASCTTSASEGTPGLMTIRSASNTFPVWPPISNGMFFAARRAVCSASFSAEPLSLTNTAAPFAGPPATATPLRAAPSTEDALAAHGIFPAIGDVFFCCDMFVFQHHYRTLNVASVRIMRRIATI